MKTIEPEGIEWFFADQENIHVRVFPMDWDKKLSIIHAKIEAGQTMTDHHHERADTGHEIYFFYKGGHFKYRIGGKEGEYNDSKPMYLFIENKEKHTITNLDDKVLEFQAIYTPRFEMDEVRY